MKRFAIAVFTIMTGTAVFAQDAAPAAPAAAPQALTFREALERALAVNNTVERSRAQVDVAEANKDFLFSAVLPRITLNGNLTRNSLEQSFGEGSDAIAILPRNNWDYRVTLNQPIYAGRRELRAYSQAKINVETAKRGTEATDDAVLLQVSSAYLALVNAEARMELEQRNIELAQKRRTQAQAFYEAGEVTRVDVLRADTSVKAAQRVQAAARQTRENAESSLRAALDLNGAIAAATPEGAQTWSATPDEQTLIARAESRPDVKIAENNARIAHLEVAKQRGFWQPVVRFEAGYVQQRSPFPTPEYGYGTLNFNVPIWQSGEVQARVAGARAQELQAQLDLENAKTAAREDVRRALVDLHAAETSLGLAREQLAAAEAEYNQSFELYRAQEATSLDLSAAETSLADARRAVAEETLNRDVASLRVWYAAGAIKEAVGVTAPAAPQAASQPSTTASNEIVAAAAQE